jgi:thioredoxin-like negative regulator of GroEL
MGDGKKPGIQLRASPLKKKMPQDDEGGPVQPIRSIDAFVDAIENAPKDSLVIVKFHAKWCKVCARVTVKMRQMAQRLAKKGTPVPLSFISVEISANNEICSTLGIKKFPFVHMYRNKECVAAFGTGPAHNFQKVVGGTLDEKMSMTDDQWEEFRMEFKNEIGEGLEKFEALKLSTFFDGDDVSSDDSGSGSDSGVSP